MKRIIIKIFLLALLISGCGTPTPDSDKLSVVATTTIIGDVVGIIGGDSIDLTILLPVGVDPHSFSPTPKDLAAIANADVVFINGLGLEEFLVDMIDSSGSEAQIVSVSENVSTLASGDPHVWLDVENVIVWADNILNSLVELDADNESAYQANAQAYQDELADLDQTMLDEFAEIPAAQRVMVTDHDAFLYFAQAYDITLIGAVIPSYSTLAEPSAQELAALQDVIRDLNAPAVFVGTTISPSIIQRLAEDTGMQLVTLYTGSLSEAGGPAGTYIEMMRFNLNTILQALR